LRLLELLQQRTGAALVSDDESMTSQQPALDRLIIFVIVSDAMVGLKNRSPHKNYKM
jgi:hypothetical protein